MNDSSLDLKDSALDLKESALDLKLDWLNFDDAVNNYIALYAVYLTKYMGILSVVEDVVYSDFFRSNLEDKQSTTVVSLTSFTTPGCFSLNIACKIPV